MINKKNQKKALISVFNKSKIIKLSKVFNKNKIKILSTSGTRKTLIQSNIPCKKISHYTKFEEILNGQVKTLHPIIYSGILNNLNNNFSIDFVICNFYPFEKMISTCKKKNFKNFKKYIDIGGPSLIRAAAKNYKKVIVIIDIKDYDLIIEKFKNKKKKFSSKERLKLAMKAFKYSYNYEYNIYKFFKKKYTIKYNKEQKNISLPKTINLILKKEKKLIYGENKHQKAAIYYKQNIFNQNKNILEKIQGKKLSYNNILDANIALECVSQFTKPSCVIIKHGTPCGASTKKNILKAYSYAYSCDPISAFGGIIAFNKKVHSKTIKLILKNQFVEIIIAPNFSKNTLNILNSKKNLRILTTNNQEINFFKNFEIRSINNKFLIQEKDYDEFNIKKWKIKTQKIPNKSEIKNAIFGWKIAKFSKSNSIIYVYKNSTIAIGSGQTSRIFAIKNANSKINKNYKKLQNITLASDAFLTFSDNILEAKTKNISCIIQPGGSIKDQEIIKLADKNNISMIFTNIRHFKH
ncbi:bifunctional phosphoribosylaminoimidazolecarboxamide formyltransferase/IMP cyclohydrolase [Buchnera aphidicola]|uniref:bifunctional phosphoribosylaminoimidazolecarboxamide formyltransferase/IMP cyclohydrolase n=1 Tax=Buchnera aphidicola TaxID=9 RepID=UPI00223719FC|nr:bifunctional phosphoribosylaminoimidazolecarboxamide formyltransferase/IMP cyclohydrolase [Buchnera aphidicola]MCW5197398.1 bifunctional phosphoribosylaminoimidazolecarboxamide formyltransferase/IMP cyclohydrolase [Buchnera aphidicola (Chaitophorus viminalis)]